MHSVYFVDDELPALHLLSKKDIYGESGFKIVGLSTNPIKAIDEIKTLNPDVVFTDLKMPGITGIQLMQRLKNDGCKSEFVIVSAYGDLKDVRQFFTSSGFDYLTKPAEDDEIKQVLMRLSNKRNNISLSQSIKTPSKELNEILSFLSEYCVMNHTLESIGKRFDINPNSICNLFAKYMEGATFVSYITSLRMEKAEKLLLHTDKPIKEVAALCGYNDYFYFCRVFRQRHGMAPTRFREAGRQNADK